jgi:hypothetical protein
MPTARERRQEDKERLKNARLKKEKEDAIAARMAEIKARFPEAEDRTKEALKCPHPDYPEMDGVAVDVLFKFFDISHNMYYKLKGSLKAAMAVEVAKLNFKSRIDRQYARIDEGAAAESALYSGGDSPELRQRILDQLHSKETGRPALFTAETIAAAKAEFLERVTSIKRGMANVALKELLIRKRRQLQSVLGSILEDVSESCLEDAIKAMDISPPTSADAATKDRADALEDWRNAISCAAMWTAIQEMCIQPALIFSMDEVSCWLTQRGTKIRFCRYPKEMLSEAKARKMSAGTQVKKTQPRCMYIECMSNAEGDLVSTIVRCVDDCVPKNKYILKQADADKKLFVCFVNKDHDKASYSKTMMTRIWIPKIKERQRQATVHMRHHSEEASNVVGSDSPNFSDNEASAIYLLQPGERVARAILTFDGAYEHIEAIMSGSLADHCRKHNIGLFKWAAGCSLVQQPADVCKCHKLLHAYFKKPHFVYNVEVFRKDLKGAFAPIMSLLDQHKAKSITKSTFMRFFFHLPDALASSFLPVSLREGYSVCGVHPFDVSKIMSGWNPGGARAKSSWNKLLPEEQTYVRVAIEALSKIAREKGFVSDEEIESCVVDPARGLTLGQLMEDANIPEYLKCQVGGTKENPGKGINRRRCILMTHASWLLKERRDVKALPPKVVDKYGKDFELKLCKCGSKAFSSVANHVKLDKHQQHCANLVEALRAGQTVPDASHDSAVTLARRYVEANPVAIMPAAADAVVADVVELVELRDGEEMGFFDEDAVLEGGRVEWDNGAVEQYGRQQGGGYANEEEEDDEEDEESDDEESEDDHEYLDGLGRGSSKRARFGDDV